MYTLEGQSASIIVLLTKCGSILLQICTNIETLCRSCKKKKKKKRIWYWKFVYKADVLREKKFTVSSKQRLKIPSITIIIILWTITIHFGENNKCPVKILWGVTAQKIHNIFHKTHKTKKTFSERCKFYRYFPSYKAPEDTEISIIVEKVFDFKD